MNITLGITGSVAIVKVPFLISALQKNGHKVCVVATKHAMIFEEYQQIKKIADAFYTHKLHNDLDNEVSHISLAQKSDLILITPATYNFINKVAIGIADDMLTTIMSASTVPVLIAPAMNTKMWENKLLKSNLDKLIKKRNYKIIAPRYAMLACGYEGMGAMAEIEEIVDNVENTFNLPLIGKNITVTCGATRVYIDPIRFISNTSTGIMGHEIAKAYSKLGANVVCICANTNFEKEDKINYIEVETPSELLNACTKEFSMTNLFVMTAAVSDYEVVNYSQTKIKKQDDTLQIDLKKSVDILKALAKDKKQQIVVGFAAEDTKHIENGFKKLVAKNLDYIIVNDLKAFGANDNTIDIIDGKKTIIHVRKNTKKKIAQQITEIIKI